MVLKECNGDEQPSKILLETMLFRVQIYDLPLNLRDNNVVFTIGSKIGKVAEVDPEDYG